MAFQLSPGVSITEKDITLIVPAVATTPGALIAPFKWGPAEEVTLIDSEKTLLNIFGGPTNNDYYAQQWFQAANFLSYGNNLSIVRLTNTHDKNAVSTGTAVTVKNLNNYTTQLTTLSSVGPWVAKYPGTLGNSLKVVIIDAASSDEAYDTGGTVDDYAGWMKNFDNVPSTSAFAESLGLYGIDDEIHILVIDEDGEWTGTPGTVLEKYAFLSKAANGVKSDGTNNYYKNVINNQSKYIWWTAHPTGGTNWGDNISLTTTKFDILSGSFSKISLTGGTNHTNSSIQKISDADIASAYNDYFGDPDASDVSLFLGGALQATAAKTVIEAAEKRKDCIAFVSTNTVESTQTLPSKLTSALTYRSDLAISSSYGVLDSGNKLQYDRYNDVYRFIPMAADVAGCVVRTAEENEPWYSPAGENRGRILNSVSLAYNPPKAHRDELYKKGINPIVSFQGAGPVLFGDKTLLTKPSAFDRINVRRLFIILEKSIAIAARNLLFEFNDEFTRSQFKLLVEPYLRNVQARRGITDYLVVCDETNNTPQVIDSNNFVADIFVKPTRSINFIQLNFIATPTGLSFEEVTGA